MKGCGVLTKGSDPKDDPVPCGTRLWLGKDTKSRTESVLLCLKCQDEGVDKTPEL
jgi:hypothetical protein